MLDGPSSPKMGKDKSGGFHPSKVLVKAMKEIYCSTNNNGIIYILPKARLIERPDYVSQNTLFSLHLTHCSILVFHCVAV